MSKRNFINIISIFLLLNLITITKQDSQIKIYSYSQDNTFVDPFDDDTELNTTDKNCNMTEYPEQARKCNNKTMVCKDEKYLHHCSCKEGYITYVNDTNNITYCNFRQKKQLIAFLLELCVGFGAGHFYRSQFVMASLKLVTFVAGLVFLKMSKTSFTGPLIAVLIGTLLIYLCIFDKCFPNIRETIGDKISGAIMIAFAIIMLIYPFAVTGYYKRKYKETVIATVIHVESHFSRAGKGHHGALRRY